MGPKGGLGASDYLPSYIENVNRVGTPEDVPSSSKNVMSDIHGEIAPDTASDQSDYYYINNEMKANINLHNES